MPRPVYIPVIRNRQEEMEAIKSSVLPGDIVLPMLEIVQNKKSDAGATMIQDVETLLSKKELSHFIVDIPWHYPSGNMKKAGAAYEFRTVAIADETARLEHFSQLPSKDRIYAAVSLPASGANYQTEYKGHANRLVVKGFKKLAFVIFAADWRAQIDAAADLLVELRAEVQDAIFIFRKTDGPFAPKDFQDALTHLNAKVADPAVYVVHDNVKGGIAGADYTSGNDYNPSKLPAEFAAHGFTGFGDFCGLPMPFREAGGGELITATLFLYTRSANGEYCTKIFTNAEGDDRSKKISGVIRKAQTWRRASFSPGHQENCPGCEKLDALHERGAGTSPGMMKRIAVMHYLAYMIENLGFDPAALAEGAA